MTTRRRPASSKATRRRTSTVFQFGGCCQLLAHEGGAALSFNYNTYFTPGSGSTENLAAVPGNLFGDKDPNAHLLHELGTQAFSSPTDQRVRLRPSPNLAPTAGARYGRSDASLEGCRPWRSRSSRVTLPFAKDSIPGWGFRLSKLAFGQPEGPRGTDLRKVTPPPLYGVDLAKIDVRGDKATAPAHGKREADALRRAQIPARGHRLPARRQGARGRRWS
jgi:hypothetical protein